MPGESKVPGYVLKEAEGRSYRWGPGYLFTIKAMGNEMGDDIAFIEFATEKGKEPPTHTHKDEDEIFYVLNGELTFTCGDDSLDAGPRDFVFLPGNVPHSYTIKTDGLVQLLVVTVNREEGGRRFGRDIEETGERVNKDTVLRHMEELRGR
ncbi:MAG: cupin domain-containing protein [Chloroflexi bacterium]|nr:MAG: cupin domain-containing protein [Chloroflexota bacterium]